MQKRLGLSTVGLFFTLFFAQLASAASPTSFCLSISAKNGNSGEAIGKVNCNVIQKLDTFSPEGKWNCAFSNGQIAKASSNPQYFGDITGNVPPVLFYDLKANTELGALFIQSFGIPSTDNFPILEIKLDPLNVPGSQTIIFGLNNYKVTTFLTIDSLTSGSCVEE